MKFYLLHSFYLFFWARCAMGICLDFPFPAVSHLCHSCLALIAFLAMLGVALCSFVFFLRRERGLGVSLKTKYESKAEVSVKSERSDDKPHSCTLVVVGNPVRFSLHMSQIGQRLAGDNDMYGSWLLAIVCLKHGIFLLFI